MTDVFLSMPGPRFKEGSSTKATAYFRSGDSTKVAAWANSTAYEADGTVTDSGTMYTTALGGTSSGTGVGDDVGVTDWVATTAKYRIDCLTTGKEIVDWTSLTPSTSNKISITATYNAIQNQSNTTERKQLTVAVNPDLDNESRDTVEWIIENIVMFDS